MPSTAAVASADTFRCRRAEAKDAAAIREILASSSALSTCSSSSPADVSAQLERILDLNVFSCVAENAAGKIVGFASASDNVPRVDVASVLASLQEVVADSVVSVSCFFDNRKR